MKSVLWHVGWLVLAAWAAVDAQQYKLSFSRTSSRTSWRPSFPSWSYSTPVRFSAVGDTTSKLTINASASMGFTLDDRSSGKSWAGQCLGPIFDQLSHSRAKGHHQPQCQHEHAQRNATEAEGTQPVL